MKDRSVMQHDAWVRALIADRLGGCSDCNLLASLNHRVYRVSTPRGSRILKVGKVEGGRPFEAGARAVRDSLAKERLLLERLRIAGMPVPRVVLHDLESDSEPWLLMDDCGPSTVAQFVAPADRTPVQQATARCLCEQMGRTLADLHRIEMPAAGEIEYDASRGSLRFRPRDWRTLADRLTRVAQGAVHRGWLTAAEMASFSQSFRPPETAVRLCHGDFHAVQAIVDDGQLRAVVDWQSAWAGDPLVDLAVAETNLAMYSSPEFLVAFRRAYEDRAVESPWLADCHHATRQRLGLWQALALVEVAERTGHAALRERALGFLRRGVGPFP
jgi:aminoglycoside phosphotransferase (APT) family kinase protein